MIRLSSYSVYFPPVILLVAIIVIPVELVSNSAGLPWYTILFFLPFFAGAGYTIYRSRNVYYDKDELYLGRLFSNKLTLIRKDRLGSIDKLSWFSSNSMGNYRITYYDDDNNVKYVRFNLNIFLSDGREIIDKLNEIN
ncbi:MAG TPA: hypothetical protein VFF57_00020 [Hanamia sp.]|nr:hypothetical protein [Hanamia sp.]